MAPAVTGLGINGLCYGLGATALRSPIGFSGGFLFGVVGSAAGKLIRIITDRCLPHTNPVSRTIAVAADLFGSTGAAWGVLAMTGYRLSLYHTVTLTLTSLGLGVGLILTLAVVCRLAGIMPKTEQRTLN